MPTIIPSYVYSLFAALVVGAMIIASCSLSVVTVKNEATRQQLMNIDEYVATQCLNLVTKTMQDYQNATQFLNLPAQIGNQEYWVYIGNDLSSGWVQSGLGTTFTLNQPAFNIPANIEASGTFVSGWGRAELHCYNENQTLIITLTSD